MKNILAWGYGITAYLVGFGSLVLFILFTLNLFIPFTVDQGGIELDINPWFVNMLLIAFFGVQHSLMARPKFKSWVTKFIHPAFERSTYLIASSMPLITIVLFWQPMNGTVWNFEHESYQLFGLVLAALGWVLVLATTFLINHFDLFGLRQIYFYSQNKSYESIQFKTPSLYRLIRHPMQFGVVIGVASTATMSTSHALLAFGFITYILIGLFYEERDLVKAFGNRYKEYQQQVPKLIPFLKVFNNQKQIKNNVTIHSTGE